MTPDDGVLGSVLGYGWLCPYCRVKQDEGQKTGVYYLNQPVCAKCAFVLSELRRMSEKPKAPTPLEMVCVTCGYWKRIVDQGECRRRSPGATSLPWPITKHHDWCGDWSDWKTHRGESGT